MKTHLTDPCDSRCNSELVSLSPLVMSDYLGQLDCEVARELSYKLYSDIFLFNINFQTAEKYFNRGGGCGGLARQSQSGKMIMSLTDTH